MKLVGCTIDELRVHLESTMPSGCTWDDVHIDHIRPCASFDLSKPFQQLRCFHGSNLQLLRGAENFRIGSLWNGKRHRRKDLVQARESL